MQVPVPNQLAQVAALYQRVFRQLRPRTPAPEIHVEFKPLANPNSAVRLANNRLEVRLADIFQWAPESVQEALAYILLCKLFRKPVPGRYLQRYRRFLNRPDVSRRLQLMRRVRGRKLLDEPKGQFYDLEQLFDELNARYFGNMLPRPRLGWSRSISKTVLGHYDPAHETIVLNRILDRPEVPRLVVEYVLFHEMLHILYPARTNGTRRCVHTPEFREAEKQFEQLQKAKELLQRL